MKKAAFVIPVHNRRSITLACLENLRRDGVFGWADVIVVDDGSLDGTGAAVRESFPEAVLIAGDGALWWTGATALGMKAALAGGAEAVFWLNDDCSPLPGACRQLLDTSEATGAIVSGVCVMPADGPVVYGGLKRTGVGLRLMETYGASPEPCDSACGNFVCLPGAVIERLGWPDALGLPHAHGDTDYLLRATARGFALLTDPRARAWARPNAVQNYSSWMYGDLTILEMWRGLWRKNSYAYFPSQTRFLSRHFGLRGFLYSLWTLVKRLLVTLVRLVVPLEKRRLWWGGRSAAWREERCYKAGLAQAPQGPPAATEAQRSGNQKPPQPGNPE